MSPSYKHLDKHLHSEPWRWRDAALGVAVIVTLLAVGGFLLRLL